MSDRPMRLKYLTKMKIILCIFLLCITAVSVFGRSVELNSVVGGSVKFPAAVKIEGNLRYSGEVAPIGVVTSGRFTTPRDGRLQWDSSTGLFYLSGLRVEDSGIYTVQDTQQTPVSTFNLTVWEGNVPVSKPQVSFTHDEYPCTILCAAARGTEVTLSWYREGQKKPYGSYPVRSAPDLYLPQTVHKGGIYTCEAKNSVSNEKASITVGDHCTAGPSTGTIVAISIAVVALFTAVVSFVKYRLTRSELEVTKSKLKVTRSELEVTRSELEVTKSKLKVTKSKLEALISVIEADKILDKEDPHAYDTRSELEDTGSKLEYIRSELKAVKTEIEDEQAVLLENQLNIEVQPSSSDFAKSELEAAGSSFIKYTRSELKVKDEQPLFRDVRDFIFHRNAPNVMASFHQTEFLLNQANPEVGTA